MNLDLEFAIEVFDYDKDTGRFKWKCRAASTFKSGSNHRAAIWNAKHAGREIQTKDHYGYVVSKINGERVRMARVAWLMCNGHQPDGEIDHINGVRDDDRIENLRVVDRRGNCINTGMRRDNSSGVRGVCWNKKAGKWQASIRSRGKSTFLGFFSDLQEAEKIYNDAAKKLHGEYRRAS